MVEMEAIDRAKIQTVAEPQWKLERTSLHYKPGILHGSYSAGMECESVIEFLLN